MLVKKKPFPGDDPDQKVNFSKKTVKPPLKKIAKKEDKKAPKGKKNNFWAKKAAMAVAKSK